MADFFSSGGLWRDEVLVSVTLDPEERTTISNPEPYFCLVPRVSYFPLVLPEIERYFRALLPAGTTFDATKDLPWLEVQGQPLRWQHPVGCLYDLYTAGKADVSAPLPLVLHLRKFPTATIIPMHSPEAVRAEFMQMVKEATFLRDGNIKAVNSLVKEQTEQIIAAMTNRDYALFERLTEAFRGQEPLRFPIRVHLPGTTHVQLPILAAEMPAECTLGDVMARLLPTLFPSPAPAEGSPAVVAFGAALPLSTPVGWLLRRMAYPDQFLHLAVPQLPPGAPPCPTRPRCPPSSGPPPHRPPRRG
ncbi:putative Autophagy-specific protein 5 [Paratrimastix pyriformis]|uniref:Autophagy protein 5 n=1 Tax=Paratrimastix pyriformis TaxID=342808 RepID=A0ABQ8UMW9_9EUKA|nr:putative Autophagy-specific protein 5 [Paratrimastix pyriformis]